jgi:hypothetical protein
MSASGQQADIADPLYVLTERKFWTIMVKLSQRRAERIAMENATFRKWLAEHGCRFDTQSEERGDGHGTLTIHRQGRTAQLPLVGPSHQLDPQAVRQACEALGLDWSKLPGPTSRV